MTLITSKTNREIQDKDPDYLENIDESVRKDLFIPTDNNLYNLKNYDRFLEERRKLIANELNTLLTEKRNI